MARAIRDIAIIGRGIGVQMAAAFLSQRMQGSDGQITIINIDDVKPSDKILLRPDIKSFHGLLGIGEQELALKAKATPAFTTNVGDISLPFGQYGLDQNGVEFQHLWKRASLLFDVPPLAQFNLALRAASAHIVEPFPGAGLPACNYGYYLQAAPYAKLLRTKFIAVTEHNATAGDCEFYKSGDETAVLKLFGEAINADLIIDVGNIVCGDNSNWRDNLLPIAPYDWGIPGIDLHVVQTALDRLISLWPDCDFSSMELSEYNRMTRIESERIGDMAALLNEGAAATNRLAVARKLSVFTARGRVPMEDYEVFTRSEWMAAILASGVEAGSYDRLAERLPKAQLKSWIFDLERRIGAAINQMRGEGKAA